MQNNEVKERVIECAIYIVENHATVRQTGKVFNMSKSSVHNDMQNRLRDIDNGLYSKVRKVLEKNLQERHIRGGLATKNKFIKIGEKK